MHMATARIALLAAASAKLVDAFSSVPKPTQKNGFVLLGANGDNVIRQNGVLHGLYEAWCGGIFGADTMEIYPISSHPEEELRELYADTLGQVQGKLDIVGDWECNADGGVCTPDAFINELKFNSVGAKKPDGSRKSALEQAQELAPDLEPYASIIEFMSIPPYAYGEWAEATANEWDKPSGSRRSRRLQKAGGRLHLLLEKPFGTSKDDAHELHDAIAAAGIDSDHEHMIDHWLNFFMIKNLPAFRPSIEAALGVKFSSARFSKIVITQYEERGLEGRGGFFDGVGQVRDMIQSHLLQTLALLLITPADATVESISTAKSHVVDGLMDGGMTCSFGQYDGFLLEEYLTYHAEFADSTLVSCNLTAKSNNMNGVEIVIRTGKMLGEFLYSIDMYQKGGPGVLTYDIGKESLNLGDVKVRGWDLADGNKFTVPAPGFKGGQVVEMTPNVVSGHGAILNYSDPNMYFPTPYAMMVQATLDEKYDLAFATWKTVEKEWALVEDGGASKNLDPAPDRVRVYGAPDTCGNHPPDVCYTGKTVQDVYEDDFECTAEHDIELEEVDLYQAKCHAEEFQRRVDAGIIPLSWRFANRN